MNRLVLALAAVALLGGCKKKRVTSSGSSNETLAKMSEFASYMCDCKDKACADEVQERLTKWSTDMAAKASASRSARVDEATMKKMTYVGQRYATCMKVAMRPPRAPEKPSLPADVGSPATVEAVLTSARTWARGEHTELHIVQLDLMYVGADGIVDRDHGKVTIELGRTRPLADDPKRRTGAPVVAPASQPTTCTQLSWTAQGWKKLKLDRCGDAAPPFPRCSVSTLWKRAIDKGAPADALAVLTLREDAHRRWTFTINDEPRKVAISHTFDDDCELVVEQP